MHVEYIMILILLWFLSAIVVMTDKNLFLLRSVLNGLKAFWRFPLKRRIAVAYFHLPFIGFFLLGCVLAVVITISSWYRAHPTNIGSTDVAFASEVNVPSSTADKQMRNLAARIIDSLQHTGPISYNAPLWPFVIRKEMILQADSSVVSATLLHCRLWCECRTTDSTSPGYLPPGTFQLLIIQLFPSTQSYELKANTVISWEDYVKPFTLKLASKEVSS